MQTQHTSDVIVLGAGNFGTCLALHLARQGYSVHLWARSSSVSQTINSQHHNPKYLRHIELPPHLKAFSELDRSLFDRAHMIVFAIPTQFLREVLIRLKSFIRPETLLVGAAKGVENSTYKLPSQILTDVLGPQFADSHVVLSGPSFAIEIAENQPTGVSVASLDFDKAKQVQNIFHSPRFRVYTGQDPIGLEVAGALKNIIAIASGACSGLGYQANSQAALITRGLAEITRIGVALGADPITFKGLGGVGDLFLTCTSEKSRNYSVGFKLGKGEQLEAVLSGLGSIAEGVTTSKSVYELCQKIGVRAPISSAVYQVLYEGRSITEVVHNLITGDARVEHH